MKNIKLLSLLLLAVLSAFSSCGDKDEDPKPKTKTELLTAKTWKVSSIKGDGVDVTNESEVAILKNARTSFKADGTYTQTTSGYSGGGVWEFAGNEAVLVFDPNTDDEERWDITELTGSSLKIRTTMLYEEDEEAETMLLELEMVPAE